MARRGSRLWRGAGRFLLATTAGLSLLVLGAAGLSAWLHGRLVASLPDFDGKIEAAVSRPVRIERDALGIPTIEGSNRADLAFATGFVHGQERFFQMDLLRRTSAGELAELFGPAAVAADRRIRVHRFRSVAERALAGLSDEHRELLAAYSEGVNAGLEALAAPPFEYLALRLDPRAWQQSDSILVVLSMFIDLQYDGGALESDMGLMQDLLPPALYAFLSPWGTEWDAPLAGGAFGNPSVPSVEEVDIRTMEPWRGLAEESGNEIAARPAEEPARGSNGWAVGGGATLDGRALLANDMHLGLRLPNIWYRMSLSLRRGFPHLPVRVSGVTLPGTPAVVVGSNGRIAWGFTNSYGDWHDLVTVEPDPEDEARYLTSTGPADYERFLETIFVNGGPTESLEVVTTVWGPIIDVDHLGRRRAFRWTAHDPEAINLGLLGLERAGSLEAALDLAARTGIPAQNFLVASDDGRIGWTIMGRIPRRINTDGWLPRSWADGSRGWAGWLGPAEYPVVLDPPGGRIWTANARVADGAGLQRIGNGGYPLGARARQIRDALRALDLATADDLARIQIDDRALFLSRWRSLLLDLLTTERMDGEPLRREFRRLIDTGWNGRAGVDSVGYRLVRAYRLQLAREVFDSLTYPCRKADPEFTYTRFRQYEGPLWELVTGRPAHLLDPRYEAWSELMLAAVDKTISSLLTSEGDRLSDKTWGTRNTVRIDHPLGGAAPYLDRLLNLAPTPLPGDSHMPRVQGTRFGASQRMVVSPGREEQGLFAMPGGQSGHPLSVHYADQTPGWIAGEPGSFLPGPTESILTLVPDAPE